MPEDISIANKDVYINKPTNNSTKEDMIFYAPPTLPTNRPIFPGKLDLISSNKLPNSRPILSSSRQVMSIDHLPLHRPVFHSDSKIVAMHGKRPVFRLKMNLIASDKLPEHRPISTSRWVQDHNMMNFLD